MFHFLQPETVNGSGVKTGQMYISFPEESKILQHSYNRYIF